MLKNYFSIAMRQLMRNKVFSTINILGLAIGMACCLMILMYVQDELGYDKFHEKGDRIYRMALERIYPGRSTSYAIIPQSYASTVKKEFPEVEESTRLFFFGGNLRIKHQDNIYEEKNAVWADSSFFDVFSVSLVKGNPKTALTQPNTVVLTESTAQKYFPDSDPIGQILDIPQNDNDLQVTGVCQDIPSNSHFQFDMIQSASSLNFLAQPNHISFSAYTYLLLKENTNSQVLESKFPDMVTKYASGEVLQQFGVSYEEYQKAGNGYHYFLQPLPNIHLDSQLEAELSPPGSQSRVYIFTIIAIFILLIACINFMNLATARSAERAKEIGIRKTLGSGRWEIAGQFLFEAVLLSLLATLLAWGFLQYLLPLFNTLSGKTFLLSDVVNLTYAPAFIGFAILIGLLAGSYPAIVLSAYDPMEVLRGRFWSNSKGSLLRNALVIFQFGISATLIICTIVVYSQLSFIEGKSLGFNKDHVITLQGTGFLNQQQTETFKNQVEQLKEVVSVAGCNTMPGGRFFGISFKPEGPNEMVTGRGIIIDDNYLSCMQMKLIEGRGYSEEFEDSLSVVVNQTALRDLDLSDPIGKQLTSNDDFLNTVEGVQSKYTIIGVVEDFHFQSLHQKIEPLFFVNHYLNQRQDNLVSIRMTPNNLKQSISEVEQLWKQFLPDQPFNYTFLDRDLAQLYEAEQTSQQVFSLFAILAIFIACLGLLGLAAYITQKRTREIGIRKVLGASVGNIVALLSKDFLILVFIALLIATPVAWYFMKEWLQNFAYSIDLQWWMFALAGLLAIAIAFFTVSFQSIRAALSNPVNALKQD